MIATTTGCQRKVLVAGEQTDGRFAFVETRQKRGCEVPTHAHSREDELIYVLEGEVTFEVNGERIDRPAGTCLFLPRGTAHTFTVESTDARMLVMLSPAGLEHDAGELAHVPGCDTDPHFIEQMIARAARFGVSITGPSRQP